MCINGCTMFESCIQQLIKQLDSRCSAGWMRMQLVADMMNILQPVCCRAPTAPRTAPHRSFKKKKEKSIKNKKMVGLINSPCTSIIICMILVFFSGEYWLNIFTEGKNRVISSPPLSSNPEEAPRLCLHNLLWHGWAKVSSLFFIYIFTYLFYFAARLQKCSSLWQQKLKKHLFLSQSHI